jgi:hypothetical protein
MPYPEGLDQWVSEVKREMPTLTRSQAIVLALYSYGMLVTRPYGSLHIIIAFYLC